MFNQVISVLTLSSILLVSSSLGFAGSKGNWSAIENLVNQEVAIKINRGKVHYGILKSFGSDELTLQTAGKKRMTQNESAFNRSEVKKVWRALLFINNRQTGKGALIGAGIGTAAGGAVFAANRKDHLSGVAVPLFLVKGALIGGVVGFFAKKKHKKRDLVYKR